MRFLFLTLLSITSTFAPAQTWDSLNTQGLKLYLEGNYDQAHAIMTKALAIAEADSGKISTAYTISLTTLAQINKATGNYTLAAEQFLTTVNITDKLYASAHIDRIDTRIQLANLFLESGHYDSCEIYLKQCLKLFENALAHNHDHYQENLYTFVLAFANTQNSMASLHRKTGQLRKATQELEETVSFLKETLDTLASETIEYKTLLSNLCSYYLEVGNIDKAAQLNKEYISLISNEKSASYLYALQNQGNIYRRLELNDSAIHVWNAALSIIDGGLYTRSQLHIFILVNLGEVYSYVENYEKAIY